MITRIAKPFDCPPAFALAGAILMAAAWPLGKWVPHAYNNAVFYSCVFLWVTGIALFVREYIRPVRSLKVRARTAFVLSLFAFTVLPFNRDSYQNILAQSLAIAGASLFVYGLFGWQLLHHRLQGLKEVLSRQQRLPGRVFAGLASAVFLVLTVFLSWYCFALVPAYPDTAAQYIHGKFIASGHYFFIPSHPLRDFFPVWMMINDGKWYSQYQPLHQTLIGLGFLIGTPWLVNPLCGALTVYATYALARHVYNESSARLATLLMVGCQFMLFMSSEYMNHASALLFTTLFMLCFINTTQRLPAAAKGPSVDRWAAAAGLCIGAVFLTRPLSAVGIGLPFAGYALYRIRKHPKECLPPFLVMAAMALICLTFQAWYNSETTGSIGVFPYSRYHYGKLSSAMGFGKASTLFYAFSKMHGEWAHLNTAMFEWALPGSFFIMLLCLLPLKRYPERLLLAAVVSYTLANMANQFNSTVFGPRYMYETASAFIILTAGGIMRLPLLLRLAPGLPRPGLKTVQGITALVIAAAFIPALVFRFPDNLSRYSRGYIDSHPEFYAAMLAQSTKPALIFIGRTDKNAKNPGDAAAVQYRKVAYTNPPDDNADVIFAIDRGDDMNRRLVQYYPKRNAYVEQKGKLTPIVKMSFPPTVPSLPVKQP